MRFPFLFLFKETGMKIDTDVLELSGVPQPVPFGEQHTRLPFGLGVLASFSRRRSATSSMLPNCRYMVSCARSLTISRVQWYDKETEMKAGAASAWKFGVFRQKEGGSAAVSLAP
jgi:hypothetical protein